MAPSSGRTPLVRTYSLLTPLSTPSHNTSIHARPSTITVPTSTRSSLSSRPFSSSAPCLGLEEFFDNPKGWVWTEWELPTGRAWKSDELRIKSFDDLHKLWWVCLKEVNKLKSQQKEAGRYKVLFPHDQRLQQTRQTMSKIKLVLWERRIAYFQAQHLLRREEKTAELRAEGLSEEEITERIQELFPTPAEEIGRKVRKFKRLPPNHPINMRRRRMERLNRTSDWTIV
ncbi:39S ribosomal protein L47, mitochondrial [Rhizophlyctis rosea]|uniref:Large ribosomal subunit protein uL29m n=1 Tax=Rhizophlyctis rosea TaxID=64517 RepID=A0AAD5S948_9FUNG|nr:39S ribosomal protein L47, mitochondrial [Rhizophlyctis rosea]